MKRLKKITAVFLAISIISGLGTGLPQNILPVQKAYAAEVSETGVYGDLDNSQESRHKIR